MYHSQIMDKIKAGEAVRMAGGFTQGDSYRRNNEPLKAVRREVGPVGGRKGRKRDKIFSDEEKGEAMKKKKKKKKKEKREREKQARRKKGDDSDSDDDDDDDDDSSDEGARVKPGEKQRRGVAFAPSVVTGAASRYHFPLPLTNMVRDRERNRAEIERLKALGKEVKFDEYVQRRERRGGALGGEQAVTTRIAMTFRRRCCVMSTCSCSM